MNIVMNIIVVAGGGALGAALRYLAGLVIAGVLGTFLINILGSFFMGVLIGKGVLRGSHAQLFFGVGILGGFTTFSSFSAEMLSLWEKSELQAMVYALASVLIGLIVCFLGRKVALGIPA